jgi:hypothetical protein
MIYGPVLTSAAQFIEYAQWIIVILLVYYVIKFIAKLTDDGGDWEKRGENLRGAIKEKYDKKVKKDKEISKNAKEKAEKDKKRDLVSPIKENIKDAVEECEALKGHLIKSERKNAYHTIKDLLEHTEKAIKNLQILRKKHEGEERKKINEIIEGLHAAEETFLREVKGNIPKKIVAAKKADWDAAVTTVTPEINNMLGALGNAWNKIEEFHS